MDFTAILADSRVLAEAILPPLSLARETVRLAFAEAALVVHFDAAVILAEVDLDECLPVALMEAFASFGPGLALETAFSRCLAATDAPPVGRLTKRAPLFPDFLTAMTFLEAKSGLAGLSLRILAFWRLTTRLSALFPEREVFFTAGPALAASRYAFPFAKAASANGDKASNSAANKAAVNAASLKGPLVTTSAPVSPSPPAWRHRNRTS
ncbi:MAG: hypothetical protein ACOZEN_12455 [Thermodesulfobacteriota bacterium]